MANVDMGEVTSVTTPSFKSPLIPGKIVRIKPVPVRKNNLIVGNDSRKVRSESIMLTGSSKSILLKIDPRTGRLKNIFNSDAERIWFENKLGVELDPNKFENNYLTKLRITITKSNEDIDDVYTELDLGNADDYLKYLICLNSDEVANSKNPMGMYTADQIFYIDDEEYTTQAETDKNKVEDECLEFLFSIKEKKAPLYNFYKVFNILYNKGRHIPRDTKLDVLYNFLKELIKDRTTIHKFHDLVIKRKEDKAWYETMVFIQEAMEIGEIKYYSNLGEFKLATNETIGKSYQEVVTYLLNPDSKALRERIKEQINAQLK